MHLSPRTLLLCAVVGVNIVYLIWSLRNHKGSTFAFFRVLLGIAICFGAFLTYVGLHNRLRTIPGLGVPWVVLIFVPWIGITGINFRVR